MKVAVLNTKGDKTGTEVTLDKAVFGIEPNDHVIWLDVKRYRNAQRQGTHKTKERGEIKGSTRKIKKQKGTGTARAGSIKNPLFRGGGRVFGPRPRKYDIKLNKKTIKLARMSALSYKAKDNDIMILDAFEMGAPKTQEFVKVIKNLKLEDSKTLVVVPEKNDNVYMSSRNVKGHEVQIVDFLNTYDILNSDKIVFVGNSVDIIQDILKK